MVRISNLSIIAILEKNGRMNYTDIAKKLGISETAVRKRIKKMEESGIITGYSVSINPAKLGCMISAMIGVDTVPESYMHILNLLKDMKSVKSLYRSSGDHMIMIESRFASSQELAHFIKRLNRISGVKKTCPAILLEKVK